MSFNRLGIVFAAMAAVAIPSLATAQDGSPASATDRNSRARVRINCQEAFQTNVVTENVAATTASTTFEQLPGASVSTFVGTKANFVCLRIVFSAETACLQTSAVDYCHVQALVNGVPLDAPGRGLKTIDSESSTASAHAFEWVTTVDSKDYGEYDFAIEWRVANAATNFHADDWMLTVEQRFPTFSPP